MKLESQPLESTIESLTRPLNLSIHTLSASLISETSSSNRSSNVSSTEPLPSTPLSPAALQAELQHYKDLFAKLRFSYVEQVTKERFLKAIVADPPEIVDAKENEALEKKLRNNKAALKDKKEEVRVRIEGLEGLGRDVARRYETFQQKQAQLSALPQLISDLETQISTLQSTNPPTSDADPSQTLSLPDTLALLDEKETEAAELQVEIEGLQEDVPVRKRQVEKLEEESAELEGRKRVAISRAQEARRRRGSRGGADEVEMRGRWYKGCESALRGMLEV